MVLVSGSGTNLQALLDAIGRRTPRLRAEVVAVGADRDGIAGLERAERAGIPTFVCRVKDYATREEWDAALAGATAAHAPDLVVSAGFMKIVGPAVPGRVRRPDRSTPTPRCCPVFPVPTVYATRSRTARR